MDKEDWEMLHHNLKLVEDKGVTVKFWKVPSEFIVDATSLARNRFLDMDNAPVDEDPNNCTCRDCVMKKQLNEIVFTRTGVVCWPCKHSQDLIAMNLKQGDKFVITNNAGVTEATLTMLADDTDTFHHPAT